MAAYLAQILILLATVPSIFSISCLVVRPGYGLVTEQCPHSAVGCRIRVMSDRIDWYEWAKLYDRNQLVCVYPEEYRTESGCQKKASGSVRCWCGGSDDCNNADNSKELYERYIGPLEKKKELHSNRVHTTTEATTTEKTTTTRRTTTKKITPKIHVTRPTTRRPVTTSVRTTTTTTVKPEFPETNAHLLPTDDRDKYDETFESTRKNLEAQMKEEDERLKQMLMDEEEEMRDDEILQQEEKSKLERRERARMEEKRRLEEEERLARIEREEAEEQERRELEQDQPDDEDEDYEYPGGALMNLNSSSGSLTISLLMLCLLVR